MTEPPVWQEALVKAAFFTFILVAVAVVVGAVAFR